MNDLAVKIEHVTKQYRLGAIGGGTLKGDLQSFMARRRGKEDPNSKIGSDAAYHKNEQFLALDDVSFDVKKGEIVGIIGHNGAGKSTLLKLLSRVTAPTSGRICLNGRIASMLEVGTGFHPELTGRENVYMNGAILGMSKAEINKKFDEIVEFAEMSKFIDTPVKRYSSGMYVKLAFAVAAHLDSEIMVMDEVLAVGDMSFQKKCLEKMSKTSKEDGKTVLYVSHNMNTITQLCERCVVLDHGKLIFNGDVDMAIGYYMNDAQRPLDVDIDLSDKRMQHLSKTPKGKIQHLKLLNKTIAVYDYNEPILFDIDIRTYEKLSNLSLRVEFRSANRASAGAAVIQDFTRLEKDAEGHFTFEMHLDGLVNGEYSVCLVLYEVNEFGSYIDIDAIYPAFNFEVRDNDNKLGILWNHKNWGYIKFSDVKLIK